MQRKLAGSAFHAEGPATEKSHSLALPYQSDQLLIEYHITLITKIYKIDVE